MARQEGSLKVSNNLEARFDAPLDARLVVPTKGDLYAMPYTYIGMTVYVVDSDEFYYLRGVDKALPDSWALTTGTTFEIEYVSAAEAESWFT